MMICYARYAKFSLDILINAMYKTPAHFVRHAINAMPIMSRSPQARYSLMPENAMHAADTMPIYKTSAHKGRHNADTTPFYAS